MDDLTEEGRTMKKKGETFQWKVGILVIRQDRVPMEEEHLQQNDPKNSKEGGGGIPDERPTSTRSK